MLYPLAVLAVAQIPGLKDKADGSLVTVGGAVVGSALIGQSFTDADGNPLVQYFQTRPSAGGYDPLVSGASNLGPESVVDTLPDPAVPGDAGTPSLLTQVCARSLAVGELDGRRRRRPYCTADGVGAVLSVFHADGLTGPVTRVVSVNQACPATPFLSTYQGVAVECATPGEDYSGGVVTPIRGDRAGRPGSPADAVTASGSGLDPDISPAYAALQAPRVARERGIDLATVHAMIERAHHRPGARIPRRADGERAGAEHRAGPAVSVPRPDVGRRGEEAAMGARGQLRVYLGAAPGVGKTYKMLEEGHRRLERGTDVVVGFVESHGRPADRGPAGRPGTWCPAGVVRTGAPNSPRWTWTRVLARRPQVALVDELAHTNVPGSPATRSAGRTSRSCSTPASP